MPELGASARLILDEVLDRAALVGTFDPLAIVPEAPGQEIRFQILDELAVQCEEIESHGHVLWRLVPDERRLILSRLSDAGRLKEVASSARSIETDKFGEYLLNGALGTLELEEGEADLSSLHAAVQFVQPLAPSAPSPRDVEVQLRREEAVAAIDFLLPQQFVGREAQLARLDAFVTAPQPKSKPARWMVVTGVGGSGKSATLAAFAKRHLSGDWSGPPTIWLDFDRPLLASADPVALTLELSRQLSLFRPALAKPLSDFRAAVRETMPDAGHDPGRSESGLSRVWSDWHYRVRPVLRAEEPLVLVLDTFEEVQEDWQRERLLRWVEDLQFEGGFEALRPIIAGRAVPEDWIEEHSDRISKPVLLDDLEPAAAAQLLRLLLGKAGASAALFPCRELAERFGGNPLMLGILARFLAEEGPASASELIRGGDDSRLRGEFAQKFLYDRMLKRIRGDDPDVEKLAYPGLALRRVTPALIEQVLAGPCQLRGMNPARALDLFDKLSKQVWLVRRDPATSAVVHRRELRRLMLVSLPPDKEEVVSAIHRAAADYYRAGRDPEMSRAAQALEAVYHTCFTEAPQVLRDPSEYYDFLAALGEDVQDLPVAIRARVKLQGGRTLTAAEEAALGSDEQLAYSSDRASEALASGYSASLPPGAEPDSPRGSGLDVETEMAVAFSGIDFDRCGDLEERVVESFAEDVAGGGGKRLRQRTESDLTETAIWRSAMIAIADRRGPALAARLRREIARLEPVIVWRRPFAINSKRSALSVGQVVGALLALLDAPPPPRLAPALREAGPLRTIDLLEKLRVAALLRPLKGIRLESSLHLGMDLVAMLDPAVMKGASAILQLPPEREFRRMLDPLRAAGGEEPIRLATIARLTSRTVPADPGLLFGSAMARGVTREVHLPAQTVLRAASPGRLLAFAGQAAQKLSAWPIELRPDVLRPALARDPKRWVATLIEIADCAGMLLDLLDQSADGHPDAAGHARLRNLVAAYDRRLRRAIGESR
jgi:hypothetical protein